MNFMTNKFEGYYWYQRYLPSNKIPAILVIIIIDSMKNDMANMNDITEKLERIVDRLKGCWLGLIRFTQNSPY